MDDEDDAVEFDDGHACAEGSAVVSGGESAARPRGATTLGAALEQARLATGMSTTEFLREHLLSRHTWDRLLHERPGVDGPPISTNVLLRYTRAAGLLDSTARALAHDAAATADSVQADTENPPLTRLGEALEQGRLTSGLATKAFLRLHGLNYRTWHRLLYDHGHDRPPRASTVVRYARAAGIPDPTALALVGRTLDPDDELGAFGAALEGERRKSGEPTTAFLKKRRLSYSTWYRLLRRRSYQGRTGRTWPKQSLVDTFAVAVGLDVDLARRLVQYDRASARSGSTAAPADDSADGGTNTG